MKKQSQTGGVFPKLHMAMANQVGALRCSLPLEFPVRRLPKREALTASCGAHGQAPASWAKAGPAEMDEAEALVCSATDTPPCTATANDVPLFFGTDLRQPVSHEETRQHCPANLQCAGGGHDKVTHYDTFVHWLACEPTAPGLRASWEDAQQHYLASLPNAGGGHCGGHDEVTH